MVQAFHALCTHSNLQVHLWQDVRADPCGTLFRNREFWSVTNGNLQINVPANEWFEQKNPPFGERQIFWFLLS